jgi:spermidine synthase
MNPAILVLFFFSGASALAYETLWQRQMFLVFGASAPATTAVLTSFFCGIAFGSLIGGRIVRRRANALAFYAAMEAWIGVFALLLPFLLGRIESLYVALLQSSGAEDQASVLSFVARFSMAVVVVLPATLGMGATIPAMNRILAEMNKQSVGANVSLAYGVNTLGAVLGGLSTGFVLIKHLGVRNSTYVAVCVNALVLVGALQLARRFSFTTPASRPTSLPRASSWLVALYFGSGFLALGYEVLWLRMLGILAINGVYTFVLSLAIYLLGFSIGSLFLYGRLARRLSASRIFFTANLGVGASALACVSFAYLSPPIFERRLVRLIADGALQMGDLIYSEAVYATSLMFVPALFMGLAYPAINQTLIGGEGEIAELSGWIYFIGNLGATFGIAATGLVIVPAFGLSGTLALFCAASAGLALLTLRTRPDAFPKRKHPGYVGVAIVWLLSGWYAMNAPPILRWGKAHYDERIGKWREGTLKPGEKETTILRYKTGASGTIIVKEERSPASATSYRRIFVDDQAVASTIPGAIIDGRMLAHIPLFLHRKPSNALTVGFGSGGTSYAMTTHGVETYAVEIEPEVFRSAGFFLDHNFDVTKAARFHLISNDARDHLHTTTRKYDVISTDVTNLQYKQNASLYTREYFQLMKQSLAEGGIACAWIGVKSNYGDQLRILLRTFQSVFPYASLWFMDQAKTSFAILVGTPGPIRFDVAHFKEAFARPEVRSDLERVGVDDPYQIMNFMYLDPEGFRHFAGVGPVHTDDRPILEFSSPVSAYLREASIYPRAETWNSLRADSYVPLLEHATKRDEESYSRAERFYRLLGAVNRRVLLKVSSGTDRIDDLEQGMRLLAEALGVRPDDPRALRKRDDLEQELETLRTR